MVVLQSKEKYIFKYSKYCVGKIKLSKCCLHCGTLSINRRSNAKTSTNEYVYSQDHVRMKPNNTSYLTLL